MSAYVEDTLKNLDKYKAKLQKAEAKVAELEQKVNEVGGLICAMEVLPYLSQARILSQHVPAQGTYTDATIDGMSVLKADAAIVRKTLADTLLKKD